MSFEIDVSLRTQSGTSASKRLRRQGWIPAILFGDNMENEMVCINANHFKKMVKKRDVSSSIIALILNGQKIPALLRGVQSHPCRADFLHVDFQRVNMQKIVQMNIPLRFINEDICPGVKFSSGIVNHVMNTIEISCLPDKIPGEVIVDLKDLTAGMSIHVSDLTLPEGTSAAALIRGENPSVVTLVTSSQEKPDDAVNAEPVAI